MEAVRKTEIFWRGIECFNRRQFFTCHELLEEIWLEESAEEKTYYQGLIQVAAAFHHFLNGNLVGAESLLRAGVEKLRHHTSTNTDIDVAGLLAALQPWLERLARGQTLDGLPLPTLRRPA
ncbi:MAG: DUF309 domain-containing protein [Candidatus Acidiferrales bacterium]